MTTDKVFFAKSMAGKYKNQEILEKIKIWKQ
jgi:hypothetical protein